jgi:hypothetical protein
MYQLWEIERILKQQSGRPDYNGSFPLKNLIRNSVELIYPAGNTIFSKYKNLYIPEVIMGSSSDIVLGEHIAFYDDTDSIEEQGLAYFVMGKTSRSQTPIYICDNHNFVLEAWALLKEEKPILIHIDQHRDDAKATQYKSLYHTRICDYIDFAIQLGWIREPYISITENRDVPKIDLIPTENKICNIDLDIFAPECTVISLEDKLKGVLNGSENANLITLATSPGFIKQEYAIKIAKLLWEYL